MTAISATTTATTTTRYRHQHHRYSVVRECPMYATAGTAVNDDRLAVIIMVKSERLSPPLDFIAWDVSS